MSDKEYEDDYDYNDYDDYGYEIEDSRKGNYKERKSGRDKCKISIKENKSKNSNLKDIEGHVDSFRLNTVSLEFMKKLKTAREYNKMSQSQLAKAICEKVVVVSEYESGKAIPNMNVIRKMEAVLNCRLTN